MHQLRQSTSASILFAQNNQSSSRDTQDTSSFSSSTAKAAVAPIVSAAAIFALTAATATLSFYPSPAAATAGDIAKGSQIFTSTCAGCHAGGNNFVKEKKTLKKDALDKFVGLDEAKITEFFKKSFVHQGPVGGSKMSDEEIANVISYVVSQAIDDKW